MDVLVRGHSVSIDVRDGDFVIPGYFGTGTFWQRNISAWGLFGSIDVFWYLHITDLENFGTRIFRHMDNLVHTKQSNMDFLVQTFRHLWYSAKMSMY